MIVGDTKSNHLVIQRTENAPSASPHPGDFAISLSLASGGITAAAANIWFGAADYVAFLDQLRGVELRRNGRAELLSLDENYHLCVSIQTLTAPVSVSGDLLTHHYSHGVFHQQRLQFGFSISQEYLPEILSNFGSLHSNHEATI